MLPQPELEPAQLRAAIGRAVARGDHTEAQQHRAEYYTVQLDRKIQETLAKAPPLSVEQVRRLRALLPLPTPEAGAA